MNTKVMMYFVTYVDGKLFYHIVIDLKGARLGIKELRYMVRENKKVKRRKK